MKKRKAGNRHAYFVRAIYAVSLVALVGIPYMLKDQLSWPWIAYSILGVCILSLFITFGQIVYYGFIEK